jgi:hypothetical protein
MIDNPPAFSQRLVRKGALIEETYRAFSRWDNTKSVPENIESIRAQNPMGAPNESWLREITATLSSRFSHGDSVAPLAILAAGQHPIERWRYCLLWQFATTDSLYAQFATDFLFAQHQNGIAAFDTDAVVPFIEKLDADGGFECALSPYGRLRTARDLLRMAAAFGLVEGTPVRRFTNDPIPEDAVLFALYSLMDQVQSVSRSIKSPRWRVFLMTPSDVEHELVNLHQFRRLRYEQAGSVRELSLPHANLMEYCRSLVS